MRNLEAVVLAGGRGSRLGKLTGGRHKALLCMPDGETMIGMIMRILAEAQIPRIHIAGGYMAEQVEKYLQAGFQACNFITQVTNIGTAADGLLSIAEHVSSDFVMVHCDHYFPNNPVPNLAAEHVAGDVTYLIDSPRVLPSLGNNFRMRFQEDTRDVRLLNDARGGEEVAVVDGLALLPKNIFTFIERAKAINKNADMAEVYAYIAEHDLAPMKGVRNFCWYANVNDWSVYWEVVRRVMEIN